MDFRFSVSSVDLTEKDKSVNEANLTLYHRVVDTCTTQLRTFKLCLYRLVDI